MTQAELLKRMTAIESVLVKLNPEALEQVQPTGFSEEKDGGTLAVDGRLCSQTLGFTAIPDDAMTIRNSTRKIKRILAMPSVSKFWSSYSARSVAC